MKHATIKTVSVAALGAAIAATAAGTASAATEGVEKSAGALVMSALPVQEIADQLPAGGPEAVAAGHQAIDHGTSTLPMPAADETLSALLPLSGGSGDVLGQTVGSLLGGLSL